MRVIRLAIRNKTSKMTTVLDWFCRGCGVRVRTSLPDHVGTLCGRCAAAATWSHLPTSTQKMIDDAIRRGNIQGLLAMRAADPPIELPHAMDVLVLRHRAGVSRDASG
ncbi:hypothetical protein ABZS66_17815 [Dactylosporangium sp. NPDC005572]|uniref:hypothetical protein n=1 Tax=Dactylosporangium sp. NPDC005572 TaxID=3156889 RepID=UPI0033A18592